LPNGAHAIVLCGVDKMRARPLTCTRAVPGITPTTEALARSDDDRI